MEKQLFVLVGKHQRELAKSAIDMAPDNWCVEVKRKTRTLDQNAKLHAMLSDISSQVDWKGNKFSVEVWKRLCVAAWLREKNEQPLLIPALDGNGVDIIYEKTSKMDVQKLSELIEWCYAFGAEHGVEWSDKWMDRH